jgi:hypothetical protein
MKIDRVGMKTVQSVPGQANDLKQVMIADQQADQVQADHQVAAQVQADHQLADQHQIVRIPIVHAAMMIVHAPTVLIQIVRDAMMIDHVVMIV